MIRFIKTLSNNLYRLIIVKIGERIVELRKKNGWLENDLAKQVHASKKAIANYERDEVPPSIEAAKKIADAFEVSFDQLVG